MADVAMPMQESGAGNVGNGDGQWLTERLPLAAGAVMVVLAAWWLPVAWWYLHLDAYGFRTGPGGPATMAAAAEALAMIVIAVAVMACGVRVLARAAGALRVASWVAAVFTLIWAARIFTGVGGSGTGGSWELPLRPPWWLSAALSGWPSLLGCLAVLALAGLTGRMRRR